MPIPEFRVAAIAKYPGETLQCDFKITETYTIANAQGNSLDPYPVVIAVQVGTVAGAAIC